MKESLGGVVLSTVAGLAAPMFVFASTSLRSPAEAPLSAGSAFDSSTGLSQSKFTTV